MKMNYYELLHKKVSIKVAKGTIQGTVTGFLSSEKYPHEEEITGLTIGFNTVVRIEDIQDIVTIE